jgi:hypothetical protein
MQALDQLILDELRTPEPPQTAKELADRCGAKKPIHVYARIAVLLREGIITTADLPWRKDGPPTKRGRPRGTPAVYGDIGRGAAEIAKNGKSDMARLAAMRLMFDLRSGSGEVQTPPMPGDTEGMIDAMSRQMQAGGREMTRAAVAKAFPVHDILVPLEEANGKTHPEGSRSAPPQAAPDA